MARMNSKRVGVFRQGRVLLRFGQNRIASHHGPDSPQPKPGRRRAENTAGNQFFNATIRPRYKTCKAPMRLHPCLLGMNLQGQLLGTAIRPSDNSAKPCPAYSGYTNTPANRCTTSWASQLAIVAERAGAALMLFQRFPHPARRFASSNTHATA
jgi:hypothetical protein